MGRIYITGFKELSTMSARKSTDVKIFDDLNRTKLVYEYTENDPEFLNILRFNTEYNGKPYMVHKETTALVRFNYVDGYSTNWMEVSVNDNCTNIEKE